MGKFYLAIDIGASSGRHIVGYYKNTELITDEVYRFKNEIKEENGHLVWDINHIVAQVKEGIKKALKKYEKIESMSIDTWGVDYVLLNKDQEIYPVYAYRDSRTENIINRVHALISFEQLYDITGTQFQKFNTIYQLFTDKITGRLNDATDFLMIPEYIMYKLTGIKTHEYTNASTTGLLDGKTNEYSLEIIDKLLLKRDLFKPLQKPKTEIGFFTDEVSKEVNGNIKVVLCPTHDTASAVEGLKIESDSIYISSGTWSLLGIKTNKVNSSKLAMLANYSNEYGPNYFRFQKNIMGLWIIQCLQKQMNMDFPNMVNLAKTSTYDKIFDVNDNCFLSVINMKSEINNWYISRNITPPITDADYIKAVYLSLADSYRKAIEELESITKKEYKRIVIVGGGAHNSFLNELTSLATNKKVIALPIEATAIGNLLTQMEK